MMNLIKNFWFWFIHKSPRRIGWKSGRHFRVINDGYFFREKENG